MEDLIPDIKTEFLVFIHSEENKNKNFLECFETVLQRKWQELQFKNKKLQTFMEEFKKNTLLKQFLLCAYDERPKEDKKS